MRFNSAFKGLTTEKPYNIKIHFKSQNSER